MCDHEAITASADPAVLADIEGLDPAAAGFCRGECQAPPSEMTGSFEPLSMHVLLASDIAPKDWNKLATNVPGHAELQKALKETPGSKLTVIHDAAQAGSQLIVRRGASGLDLRHFSNVPAGIVATAAQGALVTDRTDDRVVLVCSHRQRDPRCGYCGPVLASAINKAVEARRAPSDAVVRVYPCSHVGGHAYAGNVLVYSRHAGVCFGCVTPEDVDAVANYALGHTEASDVPTPLQAKIRGMWRGLE